MSTDESDDTGAVPGDPATAPPSLLLSRAHYPVTVLGPGTRAGIWTQGCTIHCPGCLSRDTWVADPARAVPVESVLGWLASLPPLDGVTISGGEPFQQPAALRELLLGIRDWRGGRPIDILVYSGYSYSRLRGRVWSQALLELCDAVIAGPYVARLAPATAGSEPGHRPPAAWLGSANQRLVPLSPLGREKYGTGVRDDGAQGDRKPQDNGSAQDSGSAPDDETSARIQVCVAENRVYYIGIPRPGDMDRLTERMARAGIDPGEVSWHP
jgi:anaerobic ribonucleoside-triphosphate reductase activating protein